MAKLQTATVIRSFLPFTGYRSSGHRSRINSLAIPLQNRSRSLSPSTVKSKYAHGLFPYLRLDCRRLLPVPWDLCRRFSDSSARPIPQHLWQHRPVHRATPRQRRTTSERRHSRRRYGKRPWAYFDFTVEGESERERFWRGIAKELMRERWPLRSEEHTSELQSRF